VWDICVRTPAFQKKEERFLTVSEKRAWAPVRRICSISEAFIPVVIFSTTKWSNAVNKQTKQANPKSEVPQKRVREGGSKPSFWAALWRIFSSTLAAETSL